MFTTYIAKASANIGFPTTRPIYEGALEVLANKQTARMCSHFAQDWPDRPIYADASQLCDLRVLSGFWTERYSFEIDTGSEDTFREMLNIKRGVHAQSSSDGCGASMHDGSGGRSGRCGRPGGASKDMTLSLRRRLFVNLVLMGLFPALPFGIAKDVHLAYKQLHPCLPSLRPIRLLLGTAERSILQLSVERNWPRMAARPNPREERSAALRH